MNLQKAIEVLDITSRWIDNPLLKEAVDVIMLNYGKVKQVTDKELEALSIEIFDFDFKKLKEKNRQRTYVLPRYAIIVALYLLRNDRNRVGVVNRHRTTYYSSCKNVINELVYNQENYKYKYELFFSRLGLLDDLIDKMDDRDRNRYCG